MYQTANGQEVSIVISPNSYIEGIKKCYDRHPGHIEGNTHGDAKLFCVELGKNSILSMERGSVDVPIKAFPKDAEKYIGALKKIEPSLGEGNFEVVVKDKVGNNILINYGTVKVLDAKGKGLYLRYEMEDKLCKEYGIFGPKGLSEEKGGSKGYHIDKLFDDKDIANIIETSTGIKSPHLIYLIKEQIKQEARIRGISICEEGNFILPIPVLKDFGWENVKQELARRPDGIGISAENGNLLLGLYIDEDFIHFAFNHDGYSPETCEKFIENYEKCPELEKILNELTGGSFSKTFSKQEWTVHFYNDINDLTSSRRPKWLLWMSKEN